METTRKYPKLSAIFFDLDNTLIQTRKADSLACNKLHEILWQKYAVPLDTSLHVCSSYLRAFRKCPEHPNMALDPWRHLLWTEALGDRYSTLADRVYQEWLNLRYHYLAMTSDIQALLKNLRKNYLLCLITNGPSNAQWEKVERLNLKPFFDLILVSGDLPWEKPHHKIFHEACDYLGIAPHQCIMVGDKLDTDILGGIQAKLGGTVWIPLASKDIDDNDPIPDYVIDNVIELPSLLPDIPGLDRLRNNKNKNYTPVNKGLMLSDLDDCNSNSSDGS